MATTTTNLGLTKPAYTETADISVINTNMDTIDTAIKSLQDTVATKTSNTGTVTSVATSNGLTGGTITTSGTLSANLRSTTKLTNASAAATETSGRVYPVALDKDGYLACNVPWANTDTNTTYSASNGVSLSSTTFSASLRSTTKLTYDSAAATTTSGRVYPVALDKSGYLACNVPWSNTNTTYSAGTGLSLSGTTFSLSDTGWVYLKGSASSTSDWCCYRCIGAKIVTVVADIDNGTNSWGSVTIPSGYRPKNSISAQMHNIYDEDYDELYINKSTGTVSWSRISGNGAYITVTYIVA